MSKFLVELRQDIKRMQQQMNFVWKHSVSTAFNQTVMMTPVDKGIAKASWLIGYSDNGEIGSSVLSVKPSDIPNIGSNFLLYSNIDYMKYLEDGSSDQAPSGMVKVTVSNFDNIVARFERVTD